MKRRNDTSQYQQEQHAHLAKHQPSDITLIATDSGTDDNNKKTGFIPSNNHPGNRLAKSHTSNNPDWYTITRNLDQKTKMELILGKKCLWCHNKGHNYKDCGKQQAKQPMVTAAQALSIRRE